MPSQCDLVAPLVPVVAGGVVVDVGAVVPLPLLVVDVELVVTVEVLAAPLLAAAGGDDTEASVLVAGVTTTADGLVVGTRDTAIVAAAAEPMIEASATPADFFAR